MATAAELQRKIDTKNKKDREEKSYMNQNGSLLIGGLAGVGVMSYVTTKMPRTKSVFVDKVTGEGKLPTEPLVAGGLTLLGMAGRNYGLVGAGMMIGGNWIGTWVSDQAWAQPS